MELGRLRKGEWLMAVAAVALLRMTFAPWFFDASFVSSSGGGVDPDVVAVGAAFSAWEAFTVWDVVLALLAATALGAAVLAAVRRSPAAPIAAVVVTAGTAILVAPILLLRIAFPPGPNALVEPRYGAWLGLLCVVAIGAGAWLAMGDERTDAIDPPPVPAQPVPPEVAPAGSVVAEGRAPGADAERD